jgi:hypothetical protein
LGTTFSVLIPRARREALLKLTEACEMKSGMAEPLHKLDLTTFFLSISSAAFMSLDSPKMNLELARQNIDLLELMREKTRGNRSPDEDKLLDTLLFETRMRYVQAKGGSA